MGLINWLNRYLGKTEADSNLEFEHFREDSNAKLELVRLEDRIVLSVSAGLVGDVLEIDFDAASDEATISVENGGTTLEVDEGPTPGLPGSILQLDLSQISSILVTGTDSSQVINFLGQENLVLPGTVDLTGFTGDVNLGIEIQVDPTIPAQFNAASTVTFLGQFELTGDQLDIILPDVVNSDDSFIIQINGPNLEIIDPDRATPLLFTTPTAGLTSINIFGADGETDILKLDYNSSELANISITFDGGVGGNDALEFFGGTFDTITHDLTGPGAGSIDLSDNGITEISYTGLEPVFGGNNTADNVVINLPTATTDAMLENATIAGEMQIRSLSSAFELTTFAVPADSLTITTAGGSSVVTLNSFDAAFAPTDFIISGNAGDTYQLTASDLLADTVSLTLSGGATLDLGAFNETVDEFILEDGTVIATSGILSAQSDLDLRSGSVKAQLNGTDLIKNGVGTVILDALNSYSGTTTINDGILQLAQSNAIPNTSSVNLTAVTSVLDLNGFEVSLTSLTGPGTIKLGAATGVLDINQAISTSSTFAGSISGDGSLTISGAGDFTLSETSSITGDTNVQNGSLSIEGSLTTSEIIVASGAVLSGSGSVIAPVTVNSGGKIAPGSSPGILSSGDLTLNSGSTLDVEITGTTAGTEYDQIQVTGTVDITDATLNLISAFTAAAGNEFLLIDNDGTNDPVTGTFNGLAEGAFFAFNGNQVYITYQGGDGNDVVLTVNTPPSADNQTFDVDENTINTTSIDTIVASDTDLPPDALSFSVTGGSGQTVFNVSTSGEITVVDQTKLDFETTTSFELEILVTDSAGATDTATITIDINPLNDNDPVVANQIRNVDENSINGTNVGLVIVATDDDLPGDTLTFSETGGTGADAFDITAAGQIVVVDQNLLNFETNPTYTLDILVNDNAGGTTAATITINLNDLVETLIVDPGDWAVNDITLVRDGSQLRVLETGTLNEIVPSHNFANVSSVIITGNAADNITRLDLSGGAITPAGGINFNGGTGSNTLVAPNQTNDWDISGINSGSLLSGTIVFSNVQNLTGNNAADTFVMQDGGKIDGTINGGLGFNTLDFSADSDVVTVDISTASATTVNLGLEIDKIIGDNTQDRIIGGTASATYVINGVNQGVIDAILQFEGFNDLTGADGIDLFQFTGAGQITGSINGLTGVDVLDYSSSTFALDLMITATGLTNGFAGTETSTVTSFDNINTLIGSGNTDSLTGVNSAANWSLDGSNQYTSSNTLDFSNFENLVGGTDVDTFTISGSQTHNLSGNSGSDIFQFEDGASLSGNIDGQSGADQLDFSLFTTSLDVVLTASGSFDGFQGTESTISGGFDNINSIAAGTGATDKLTGQNAAATWSIQPASTYGSGTSLGFADFETLQGGNAVDIFNINGSYSVDLLGGLDNDVFQFSNNGSTLNGIIDGQGGTDHLNLENYTTDLSVTLTSIGTTDGFDGNESAKSVAFQNIDQLTGGTGTNSLTGINSAANWSIDGSNQYSSTNILDLSGFENLTGGTDVDTFTITGNQTHNLSGNSGNDSFQFEDGASLTGTIDGQAGTDQLDFSLVTTSINVLLTAIGSVDGFQGTEASISGGFDNINSIAAGTGTDDKLTGQNAAASWSIDGSNQYSSTNTLGLNGFENLTGGTDVDTFTISGNRTHNLSGNSGNDVFQFEDGASLIGTIDGQAGTDQLDFSLVTTSLDVMLTAIGTVDGFQGTEAAISSGFDNINSITAGTGAADKLTGINAAANWSIDGSNQYTSTNTLDFSSFENLTGGTDVDTFTITGSQTHNLTGNSGNDIFQFLDGAALTGIIDGQAGTDHLNLADYTTDLSVSLTSIGSTDGFDGNESTISIDFQNIDQLTGGMGTNSLSGIDSAANWTLNGTNSYQSTNTLEFSNFFNLTGGNNTDIFNLTPDTEAFNIVGGDPSNDQLNIDTTTAGTALVTYNGDGSGTVSGTFPTITFSEIENFDVTGSVEIQLVTTAGADTIAILVAGPLVEYHLGGILVGTSSLTATNDITIDGGDGDDSLTVDIALAAQGIKINYNGEGQDSPDPGDVLNLIGSSSSVEYFFTDASSGNIRIDGATSDFIVYTGLEPITSTVTTADVTLTYSGAAETITISDAGGGQTTVNSDFGEILTFDNPTNSLTINSGAGDDIIDIESLAANFTASLIINGDGDNDTINANASISFDTGKSVEFNAETVNLVGDLISTNVSGNATIVNVLGSAGDADMQDAVDVAGSGGVINVAMGVYITAETLDVDKSVSILGAGKDIVEIRKAGAPTGNFDTAVDITADNVTISGAQLGWETHTSATDYQGYVVETTADNTTLNNLLFSDNYRSAVVFEGANDLEVSDSIFEGKFGRAAIRDGNGGSGERFIITHNEFRADHFRWGPISIGPQGSSGSPNNFAFSGEVSFNFFGNGLEAGSFQSGGDQNYTVTITNGGMTADGVNIVHNTFDWQDSATTNSNGIFAQPGGIFFDPSLAVPIGSVNITDNIFNGFTYDGPQPGAEPLWNPTGGVFGGALEFDGVDDFGLFQDPLFEVGTAGTLNLWVNMHDQGQRAQFFEGLQSAGFEFQFRNNSGGQFFGSPGRGGANGGNNYVIQNGNADGTENVWQNLQYTWDFNATGGPQMHIFIDGTEVAYSSASNDSDLSQWVSVVSTANQLITVGKDASSGKQFDGLMDDVGWFNDVLSSTERANIMDNGVAALSTDSRLVAHWDFDETSGNIAVDKKNLIEMYISTNGIVPFGPEFQTAAGKFGGALQFDGVDDFATFQDASFDVGESGTLNFWVLMEDTGRRNQFFEGPDNGGFEFQYRTNGSGQFFGRTQNGSDYTIQQGGHSGVEGIWTNIQYTWDAEDGEMHIYLDGAEKPYLSSFDENLSGFDLNHFTDTVNGLMNVGRDPGNGSRYFEGLMDDIGWFNDVLNTADRAEIMNSGVASLTGDPRLIAHWNLDDAPGTTIVPGDSGTTIDLYIQAEPPLPPIQGFGVLAPLNANVTYNAFNDNDHDSNVTLDATNQLGDPLFAYETDPLFMATDSLEDQFTIGFGSSAAYFSSEFAGDTDTDTPHIGAYQNPPTLYPGLFGKGDIVIYGTGEDDLLVVTLTSENTATFVLTRDAGGSNELVLGTVILTDITSITFNGLGGDDVLVLNQPTADLFFNPTGGVIFNGGTQNNDGNSLNPEPALNAMGDTLIINHANLLVADSVGYVFTPDTIPAEGEDGVLTITDTVIGGATTISFTGLEEPILDKLIATDRDFDFTDATETILLSDDINSYADHSFIDSDLSQSVIFQNPKNSLTVRTSSVGTSVGIDTVEINSLDSEFTADLTVLAGDNDSITVETDIDLKTGDLLFSAETVNIIGNIEANSVDISSSGGTSTTFNGGLVTTTDFQLYNDAVNLLKDSILTSTSGTAIEFKSTIDGANNLTLNTVGNTILEGAVGTTTPLASLTTNASGTTVINGGSVTTTGAQTYNDAVTFGASTIFTSTTIDDISFNSSVTGGIGFSVNIISQNEVNIIGSFKVDDDIAVTAGTDIQISSLLSSTIGNLTFLADNDITLNAAARILSLTNGQIILTADNDAFGTGSITMTSGSTVESQGGRIQLTADGTVAISAITTTGTVAIESKSAAITDNQDALKDITADEVAIRAATGIGSDNPLEIAVSKLAALNTISGHIQILNDLGGALLTLGLVDGLDGVTHSGIVTGDIIIANASPLTIDAPVTNSSGGNIELESTGPGDLILNASVRASGGHGNINVEAGDGILEINDTGVAADHSIEGTGIFSGHGNSGVNIDSNTTLTSETGAIADIPPDLRNIATPQILATGDATVSGDFGRFSEQNFFITIDWGDGTVETFNFSDPGSFVFSHNYVANPNTGNPAADIPILVTIQGDKQFTFSDGSGNLDFTSETGLLETPGDGLATVAIDTTPQVPLLLFPQSETILDSTSNQSTVFTSKDTQLIESAINEANKNAERLVFLRIMAPNGNTIEDVPLQESDLDNLPKLFKSLPDGRYQIYLKEAGEERIRLLMDVDIRGGKATDVTETQLKQSPAQNQPDTATEKGTTQIEVDSLPVLSSVDDIFNAEYENIVSLIAAFLDPADLENSLELTESFRTDDRINTNNSVIEISEANPTIQLDTASLNKAASIDTESTNLEFSEKAWSSAALLSGLYHGRTALKRPAKQSECESAMAKYGQRLISRQYNIFKRNQ